MPDSHAYADPDAALRRALTRQRWLAGGLLAAMAGLLLATYVLPSGFWTSLLRAAAQAGVVGGLADWFAVTALFRHPLGLPIPHTAIIPKQKERLGQALGRFVANQVFTEAEVRRVLARLDLSGFLRRFLADPVAARPAATALAETLPRLLDSFEDGRAKRLLRRLLPRVAGGPGGAATLARALRALIAGGRHHEVFDLAIRGLRTLLTEKEEQLREAITTRVRAEGGALVGWLAGATVARKLLGAVNAELLRMEPAESDLRAAFATWLEAEIDRLETDPERAAQVGRAMRAAADHPAVRAWIDDVWARMRAALAADAANPSGRTVQLLEAAFANAGALLTEDAAARARLDRAAESVLVALLPSARTQLSAFIAGVVNGWDTAEVTEKIELRVGRDLQYVRINGTLVGFLVGGAIYGLLIVAFGEAAL